MSCVYLHVFHASPFSSSLGITTKKSKLSYEEFLKAFEEGRKDQYPPPPEDALLPRMEYEHLTPEQAEQKMRKRVAVQLDVIQAVSFSRHDLVFAGMMAMVMMMIVMMMMVIAVMLTAVQE